MGRGGVRVGRDMQYIYIYTYILGITIQIMKDAPPFVLS